MAVPPTALFVAAFAGGYAVNPSGPTAGSWLMALSLWCGVVVLTVGVGLIAWAFVTFHRLRTGIMFHSMATRIVTVGPYRWSRNPMYVAFVAIYVGLALCARSVWPLLFLPLAVAATQKWVIGPEERYLRSMFPFEYHAYRRQVRRWV